MALLLAVDIGGTFTDSVALDTSTGSASFGKALTTPDDLVRGVMNSLLDTGADVARASMVVHGSTLVINALIQRLGVKTGLLTTVGARDVYEIGRINRPDSFNLRFQRPVPLVPRKHRYEVVERLGPDGNVVRELDEAKLRETLQVVREEGFEALAVVLLHAYRNADHERRVLELVREALPDVYVCASHEISREYREYERTSTTVANAFVGPIVEGYLSRLEDAFAEHGMKDASLLIMQSTGGVMDVKRAGRECIQMLESGPAGGVNGASTLAGELNLADVIAFDMGGTTAKATVIRGGQATMAEDYFVGDYQSGLALRVPAIDIKEVGTGGGSVAWLDDANGVHVGPRSAGASPGPAAYGLGGTEPTVTDANVVLGRLEARNFSGVGVGLREDLAREAVGTLAARLGTSIEQAALGILQIATAAMADAVRAVTVRRGLDPRDFALLAYGGAGPLHAAAVTRELGCDRLLVPSAAGVFSAFGMLDADIRQDAVQSCFVRLAAPDAAETLQRAYTELEGQARAEVESSGVPLSGIRTIRSADIRYVGQEHTLTVQLPDSEGLPDLEQVKKIFDDEHGVVYAHSAPGDPAEIVSVRVSVRGAVEQEVGARAAVTAEASPRTSRTVVFDDPETAVETAVWDRDALPEGQAVPGPVVVEDVGTSVLVWPGSTVTRLPGGLLAIDFAR